MVGPKPYWPYCFLRPWYIHMQSHNMQPGGAQVAPLNMCIYIQCLLSMAAQVVEWWQSACLVYKPLPLPLPDPALHITWLNPTDGQYSLQWDFFMCTPAPAGNLATTITLTQVKMCVMVHEHRYLRMWDISILLTLCDPCGFDT